MKRMRKNLFFGLAAKVLSDLVCNRPIACKASLFSLNLNFKKQDDHKGTYKAHHLIIQQSYLCTFHDGIDWYMMTKNINRYMISLIIYLILKSQQKSIINKQCYIIVHLRDRFSHNIKTNNLQRHVRNFTEKWYDRSIMYDTFSCIASKLIQVSVAYC